MTSRAEDAHPTHAGRPHATADPRRRPRLLGILAAPRTGSTLLGRVLSTDPAFHDRGELFHPNRKERLSEVQAGMLASHAGSVEASVPWRAKHPGTIIDLLLGLLPSGTLVIKIFPGHVEQGILRDELLGRDDAAFVVLTRRPIESFISRTKARHLGTYSRVDTTGLRPDLDASEFASWARERREWYRWIDVALGQVGVVPVRIAYERSLAVDPWSTAGEVAAELGLDFQPISRDTLTLFRQDRTESFRDRVGNWDAFAAAIDPELLAWAIAGASPTTIGR